MLTIRALGPGDPEMARLIGWRQEVFFHDWPRDPAADAASLDELAAEGWPILLASWNNSPAGMALASPDELDQPHDLSPWFCGLWTRPEFRKRGIGAGLVRAAEDAMRAAGHRRFHLYTGAEGGAEGFYARLGWVVEDRFVHDGWGGVLMARDL